MPLEFQLQQTPFSFGLAEGVDPHQVPPGTLLTAENVVWGKSGRVGKRYGTSALTNGIVGGGTVSSAARLVVRGAELCLVDGTSLYSYSSSGWTLVDKVPEVGLSWRTVLDNFSGVGFQDAAISSTGQIVHAWIEGAGAATGKVWVQIFDATSGQIFLAPTSLAASGANIRVVIISTTAIVLRMNGANLVANTINLSTLAVGGSTNLRTDSAGNMFDACVIGSNVVVCYSNTLPALKLYSYNTALAQQATGGITGEVLQAEIIGLDGNSADNLWVGYQANNGGVETVKYAIANPTTLVQTVAPVTVEAIGGGLVATTVSVCRYDSHDAIVAYTCLDTNVHRATSFEVTDGGAVTANSKRGTSSAAFGSKPFMVGGKCYAILTDSTFAGLGTGSVARGPSLNSYLVEIEVSTNGGVGAAVFPPHRYIGKIEHLLGIEPGLSVTILPAVMGYSATQFYVVQPYLSSGGLTFGTQKIASRLVSLTFGASLPSDMWRHEVYGGEAYLSGPLLAAYDGRAVFDYGFPRAPDFARVQASTLGGSIAIGTYQYAAALEFSSSVGVLHRSTTQTTTAITTTTNTSSVAFNYGACQLGLKQDLRIGIGAAAPVKTLCVPYRSVVNGTTYQRLTAEPSANLISVDQSALSQAFTDTRSDAAIDGASLRLASQPVLYTTGGVLDDESPPAQLTMTLHKQRLWVVDGSGNQVWFSKSFLDDYGKAPGFSVSFRIQFDQPVTALASMDERLIVFWSGGLWYFLGGDNILPSGASSDLQGPVVIQSDVGCTNPRSVVTVPDGVMFQSARGLYLLTRGLEVVWIGRPVQDELSAYPNIVAATLVAQQNEVRFVCSNTGLTNSIELRYNYVEKQWTVAKYTSGGVYGCSIADAILWNGVYTWVTTGGQVYKEDTTTYLDGGSVWVPLTLETAWLSANGPLAFKSVRSFQLEGTSNTNHDLTVSVGFDSDTSYPQTATFLAGSPVTTVGPLEQCEVTIGTRRKCQHIRFKIQDATPTSPGSYPVTTGQGPSFDMMGIEFGIKQGFASNPATKKG